LQPRRPSSPAHQLSAGEQRYPKPFVQPNCSAGEIIRAPEERRHPNYQRAHVHCCIPVRRAGRPGRREARCCSESRNPTPRIARRRSGTRRFQTPASSPRAKSRRRNARWRMCTRRNHGSCLQSTPRRIDPRSCNRDFARQLEWAIENRANNSATHCSNGAYSLTYVT
jgi:hypothetical protein